jgi:hypothetical protein
VFLQTFDKKLLLSCRLLLLVLSCLFLLFDEANIKPFSNTLQIICVIMLTIYANLLKIKENNFLITMFVLLHFFFLPLWHGSKTETKRRVNDYPDHGKYQSEGIGKELGRIKEGSPKSSQ